MELPAFGAIVKVRATLPNVEALPGTGRFLSTTEYVEVGLSPFVAARLRDGSLILHHASALVTAIAESAEVK